MLTETVVKLFIAFLAGAVPFGMFIAKIWGVKDLRKVGSSNIGATNVTRTAGKTAGALTFALDFSKGLAPMLYFSEHSIMIGLCAVLGHCFSPFLKFKGGKGVSTALGSLVAYNPTLGFIAISIYGLGLAATRVSALGSLFSMLTIITGALLFASSSTDKLAILFMVAIVLVRHRENWNVLLQGVASFFFLATAGTVFLATTAYANITLQQELRDFRGKRISLVHPPLRIAALMPSIAEMIVDLGGETKLVAVPEYTRLTSSLANAPKLIGPYTQISVEEVYSTHPDLVIASMDGNNATQIEQLERLGLKVLTVNTQSLNDILRASRLIASAIASKNTTKLNRFEDALKQSQAKFVRSVFLQIGWEPLVTVGKNTFIHELIEIAGGRNIFKDAPTKYPRPNPEEVLKRKPETIIICRLSDVGDEAERAKAYWLKFTELPAVKAGRIYILSGDLITRPGFNLLNGLDELRKAI